MRECIMKKVTMLIIMSLIMLIPVASYCDGVTYSTEDYSEYLEIIKDHPVFVTYEKVKEIGAFESFYFAHGSAVIEEMYIMTHSYTYGFVDQVGEKVKLHVDNYDIYMETPLVEPVELTINDVDVNDMRRISNDSRYALYRTDNIIYVFNLGNLSRVSWQTGDLYFTFNIVNPEDYPYNNASETFAYKLINVESAKELLQDFEKAVNATPAPTTPTPTASGVQNGDGNIIWYIVIPVIIIGLISGCVAIYAIKLHRKNKID